MDANDNLDRLTETSSLGDQEPHWLKNLFQKVCPCLISHRFVEERNVQHKNQNTKTSMANNQNDQSNIVNVQLSQNSSAQTNSMKHQRTKINSSVYRSSFQRQRNPTMITGNKFLSSSSLKSWHSFPIYCYKQNEIFWLGNEKNKMLAKIISINIQPSQYSQQKTKKSRTNMNELYEQYSTSVLDRFWNKRYLFFEKFDQGIKVDEESWCKTTPEAVAEHIASKIRCQTVLDGYCGVGSNSIKLALSCNKVISNDPNPVKLKLLLNNANVYNIQNIESTNFNFLNITDMKVDAVFLAPHLKNKKDEEDKNKLQIKDFFPSLNLIINNALKLTKNIILLLPANTNIGSLAQCISSESIKEGIVSPSCGMKIQKIFFMSEFKYIVVYIGPQVQDQIKLNDQLSQIYQILKQKSKKSILPKKVIKKLREQYGMINVLRYVLQSKKEEGENSIDKFYTYIINNKLIQQEKLQKLTQQQNQENEKKHSMHEEMTQVMEEEKYVDDSFTSGERTVSYYSNYSSITSDKLQNRKNSESVCSYIQNSENRSSLNQSFHRSQTLDISSIPQEIKEQCIEESHREQILEESHADEQSHYEKQT